MLLPVADAENDATKLPGQVFDVPHERTSERDDHNTYEVGERKRVLHGDDKDKGAKIDPWRYHTGIGERE